MQRRTQQHLSTMVHARQRPSTCLRPINFALGRSCTTDGWNSPRWTLERIIADTIFFIRRSRLSRHVWCGACSTVVWPRVTLAKCSLLNGYVESSVYCRDLAQLDSQCDDRTADRSTSRRTIHLLSPAAAACPPLAPADICSHAVSVECPDL